MGIYKNWTPQAGHDWEVDLPGVGPGFKLHDHHDPTQLHDGFRAQGPG